MKNRLSLFLCGFVLSGCTFLASVSTTSIPSYRQVKVKAEAEQMIVFGFNFDNAYVDTLTTELAKQCPNGKVMGILTKHENIIYFPLVAHAVRVKAEGYCVRNEP